MSRQRALCLPCTGGPGQTEGGYGNPRRSPEAAARQL